MTNYKPKNGIILFKNKKKTDQKHPDYTGTITLIETLQAGTYNVGMWIKESKESGSKFMAGEISKQKEKTEERPVSKVEEPPVQEDDF